jgi:o-succinylbenzoate synthase
MLIERIEVIPYALPFREPYVTARGRLERRELILLRVTDDEGLTGLGETTALSLRGGHSLEAIAEELRGVDWDDPYAERRSPEARCAIATALLDLELRRSGKRAAPDPVRVNATLSAGPAADVAAGAERWRELGFDTFKLKVGAGDDFEQVRAVRDAVGADARIRIDANGAWRLVEARAFLAELEPLGIELCEQPVATLEEMAELRAVISIPLAADEIIATREDAARARQLGACDLATLKLAKVGGPQAARDDWGLPVYLSSALDGPVGIAAAALCAAQLPRDAGVAHGLATQLLFSETIAARGPAVRDGMLHIPGGPGLGVEIDEAALDRHRL